MDERHPKLPTTTYAAGKAAADLAVETYVKMFDLDAMILRPFNNFGPRQNHEGPLAGVIPVTTKNILHGNKPKIHGDGLQSRDFIFVLDTVEAILKLYECLPKGESVIYQLTMKSISCRLLTQSRRNSNTREKLKVCPRESRMLNDTKPAIKDKGSD